MHGHSIYVKKWNERSTISTSFYGDLRVWAIVRTNIDNFVLLMSGNWTSSYLVISFEHLNKITGEIGHVYILSYLLNISMKSQGKLDMFISCHTF